MNPIAKVIFATVSLALLLLFGINHFVLRTEDLSLSLTLKSMAHLRDAPPPEATSTGIDFTTEVVEVVKPQLSGSAGLNVGQAKSAPGPSAAVPNEVDQGDAEEKDEEDEEVDESDENVIEITEDSIPDADKPEGLDEKELLIARVEYSEEEAERMKADLKAREQEVLKKLGISTEPPPQPTPAIDVRYLVPSDCNSTGVALAPVTVKFRFESPSIKGGSLNVLEKIIAEYRLCRGGSFQLSKNPLGKVDESPALTQRRLDEIKYFFIQHSVPKTALEYPEEL